MARARERARAVSGRDSPRESCSSSGVSAIEGSYSKVVGLPLYETWQLLSAHGIPTGLEPPGE